MGVARRTVTALVGGGLLGIHLGAAYAVYAAVEAVVRGGDLATLAVAVVAATVLIEYLSYRVGTGRLLAGLDAVEPARDRAPGLYRLRDDRCDRMGIDPPRLLVGRLGAPTAVAIGGVGDTVVIDAALVGLLDRDELRAILAHLEGYDGLVATLVHSVARRIVGAALLVALPVAPAPSGLAHAVAWGGGRPAARSRTLPGRLRRRLDRGLAALVPASTLPLLARSRRREFAAADRAAEVTGDPLALARAPEDRARRAAGGGGGPARPAVGARRGGPRAAARDPPTDRRPRPAPARARRPDRPAHRDPVAQFPGRPRRSVPAVSSRPSTPRTARGPSGLSAGR